MAAIPEGMTSEKLRAIAHWLDIYDDLTESYIAMADLFDVVPAHEVVMRARETVRDDEVQRDLRLWADQLDAG